MPRSHSFVCITLRWIGVASLASLVACSPGPAPTPAPVPIPTEVPPAPVPIEPAPADPAIVAELDTIKSRQACNRITGCSAMAGLLRHGAALVEPVRRAFEPKPPDGYWVIALTEALGQLEATEASGVLTPLLEDNRWEIQLAAARGLAYLGPKMDTEAVTALQKVRAQEPLDTPASHVRAALLEHALMRSGRDSRPFDVARASLIGHLPPAEPDVTPHPQLDAFVRLVGEARIPEGLPLVRVALHSRNRLVTATALDVAGSLQDSGAIPFVLSLLDDPNPTLRRESVRALQRITGSRQIEHAEQWRDWARSHNVEALPLPLAPAIGPQVLRPDDE